MKRPTFKSAAVALAMALAGIPAAAEPPALPMPVTEQGYQGASGTAYQYDLATPAGQIGYATDVGAQIRDSILGNMPGPQLDRELGQHGGGVQPQQQQHQGRNQQ